MLNLIVIDVSSNKWKNTPWNKERIVQIEIGYTTILGNDHLRSVLINGKTLGLIALETTIMPIGSRLFASIEACDGCLYIKALDKPDNWIANIKDSEYNCLSTDIISTCWDEDDDYDRTGEARLERMENQVLPDFFYEWIIRSGLDDRYISRDIIDIYFAFIDWLYFVAKSDEFTYGDDEIQQYEDYCEQIKKNDRLMAEAADDHFNWNSEKNRIESDYGRGARIDNYGAVFDSDGEWVGME
jgi:hypothetical protein